MNKVIRDIDKELEAIQSEASKNGVKLDLDDKNNSDTDAKGCKFTGPAGECKPFKDS